MGMCTAPAAITTEPSRRNLPGNLSTILGSDGPMPEPSCRRAETHSTRRAPRPLAELVAVLLTAGFAASAAAADLPTGAHARLRAEARAALDRGEAAKALGIYQRLARDGDAVGSNNAGVLLLQGWGAAADPVAARAWFRRAAEAGLPGGQYNYALSLLRGLGGVVDRETGLALLEQAARAGDADAHLELGLAAAVNPLRRAAAITHFRHAALAGRPLAQLNLATLLLDGEAPAERSEAEDWLQRAAGAGEATAAYRLAMLLLGRVETEAARVPEAVAFLRMAAEAGYPEALLNLGVIEAEGRWVKRDLGSALRRWRLAAELGQPAAQFNLGLAHARRDFGVEDAPEAYAWLALAAAAGHPGADTALDELASRLDPAQLRHGEVLFQQRIDRFLRPPQARR